MANNSRRGSCLAAPVHHRPVPKHKQIEAVTVERDELTMLQRGPERNG
jgi:hypothetical protein